MLSAQEVMTSTLSQSYLRLLTEFAIDSKLMMPCDGTGAAAVFYSRLSLDAYMWYKTHLSLICRHLLCCCSCTNLHRQSACICCYRRYKENSCYYVDTTTLQTKQTLHTKVGMHCSAGIQPAFAASIAVNQASLWTIYLSASQSAGKADKCCKLILPMLLGAICTKHANVWTWLIRVQTHMVRLLAHSLLITSNDYSTCLNLYYNDYKHLLQCEGPRPT